MHRGHRSHRTLRCPLVSSTTDRNSPIGQSQASVTDLNAELDKARAKAGGDARGGNGPADVLRSLLFKLPGDNSEMERELEGVERIRAEPYQQGGKRPEDMTPQELHSVLWQVLTFRDSVMKKIDKTIGTSMRVGVRI